MTKKIEEMKKFFLKNHLLMFDIFLYLRMYILFTAHVGKSFVHSNIPRIVGNTGEII